MCPQESPFDTTPWSLSLLSHPSVISTCQVGALCSTFGVQRSSSLYVGAVKTNVSHLEGAAGIAGLLKATFQQDRHGPGEV